MVNSKKGEKQAELDKIYADAKAKVTRETESAIAGRLDRQTAAGRVAVGWRQSDDDAAKQAGANTSACVVRHAVAPRAG